MVQNARFLLAFDKFTQLIGKDSSLMGWLVSVTPLIAAVASIFSPQVQAFWTAHAQIGVAVAGVYATFAALMPSPVAKK